MAESYRSIKVAILWLAFLAFTTPAASQTANPFSDPKDDPYNPLRYIPSNTLTAIAFVFVVLTALVQTFYIYRYGAIFMLVMIIGEYTYAIGFGCRFGLHYHPDSEGIYVAEYLFIVLSPCAFIAANYILLGRLARYKSCTAHVLLPVQKLTPIFVTSDITTFVIQAIGGGMTVSRNQSQQQIATHVFLAGLVLQLISFSLFSGLYVRFLYRVYTLERSIWEGDRGRPWHRDWRTLAAALAVSCMGILLRCCYRVAEISQGFGGYLATTEAFFYGLDTLPLFIALSTYTVFWPGWFTKDWTDVAHYELKLSTPSPGETIILETLP